tara:strand:+ start:26642 stop:27268 length:627 start_codon:yes stop_codon:yes gene_type:complete
MLQRKTVDTATLELLIDLQGIDSLQGFSLGGGTALALKFGHRISVDLDLFTRQPFDTEEVISVIRHKFKDVSVLNMNRNSLSLSIQGVKVDVLSHQYALLEPPEIIESVRFLSTQDIAAMKLSAVAQRGSKKDFFDLIELLNHYSLPQLLAFYGQKYSEDNYFYVLKSMTYFQDAEEEPSPVILNDTSWENVKDGISQMVENQTKTKG